ncbi:MAG: glycine dehydrogenase (aminomethyl-transferring) [Alphaproteobacteria bacterium CG11_big_fil_rev_8_21_14_0_20_44_7]|nr:MAG: glycine dehydrogenase (aminomethyl-transferring) [Alphaproteobacteria bacterium CG11_big_fil_rev_8_21_14_0_20_44_7]
MIIVEEPLLNELSKSGRSAVDLPLAEIKQNRTGTSARESIGLPQLSEPQIVRHFVRLSQQNYSIDTNFYPLGSCTMKHNPRHNEKFARFPGFANLHPLQPEKTTQGALALIYELQNWLKELTGLSGVTLNPAAGAHGELAGMMVIHKAHEQKGRQRKIVLVPDSAHGTNPATAIMCGYETKTIPSNKNGLVDLEVFKANLNEDVAAFMLTNPSTCGLFDPNVKIIADMLHEVGAYFYCDGANFNAIAGKIRPADFGVDVMHINLHKTFSTPHGGGGPGSGPIVVTEELAPYLPVPKIVHENGNYHLIDKCDKSIGRIKAFQGHFGMAVRALSYMLAHGGNGIKQASEDAVLSANYVKSKLQDLYNVPFPGHCMHECLLNDKFQREYNITTMDIAKTLIEHGFHPMTVFFPLVVQGAMLIEPTESETKETLDGFISVMREIAEIAKNNPDSLRQNPISTPRRRLDEVKAAREPKLTW